MGYLQVHVPSSILCPYYAGLLMGCVMFVLVWNVSQYMKKLYLSILQICNCIQYISYVSS